MVGDVVNCDVDVRESGRAVEMRGIVADVIGARNLQLGGAQPKVFLEDSPGKTRVNRCMGKLMGTIKGMVANGDIAAPTWSPVGVRISQANGGETIVAEINEYSGRPVFLPAECQAVFGKTPGDMMRAFISHRR